MNGEYQSVGRLNGPVGADRYRLLYEAPGGLQYRDYSFNGRQVTTSSITRVCPAARDGTLPLLSKDGTLFGTYLASEGRSKIFSTTSTDDACGPIATLPMLTGKMDFSPDNSKVAFHVDLLTDEIMFMDPTRKNKMAALLYDLNTRAASVIRDIPGQQSFYPVFLRNDRLALVNRDVHDEGYGMYSLLVGGLHAPNRATCAECTDERAPIGKFSMVLGLMYQAFCASGDRSLRAAKANVVKMNRAQCRSLISQFVDADLRGHGQDAQRLLVDAGQSFTSRIDRGNLRRVCERF